MARNRMIKPEFWEDDRLAGCPFETRLFYIASWNFADDKGFFEFREKWLKAKCFPYDDVDIRRMIDELSQINRYSIKMCENNVEIVRINNFLKHQRIDRPQASNLSHLFNTSTNDRRMIDERSSTKKKLKEVKLKESKSIKLTDEEFQKFWNLYPNKVGKKKTFQVWQSLSKEDRAKCIKVLPEHITCDQWQRDGGQFIPHPTTWLNQGRWDDEVKINEEHAEYGRKFQILSAANKKIILRRIENYSKDFAEKPSPAQIEHWIKTEL